MAASCDVVSNTWRALLLGRLRARWALSREFTAGILGQLCKDVVSGGGGGEEQAWQWETAAACLQAIGGGGCGGGVGVAAVALEAEAAAGLASELLAAAAAEAEGKTATARTKSTVRDDHEARTMGSDDGSFVTACLRCAAVLLPATAAAAGTAPPLSAPAVIAAIAAAHLSPRGPRPAAEAALAAVFAVADAAGHALEAAAVDALLAPAGGVAAMRREPSRQHVVGTPQSTSPCHPPHHPSHHPPHHPPHSFDAASVDLLGLTCRRWRMARSCVRQ